MASASDSEHIELLKKLLILELFKLRVPQKDIAKKLKMKLETVNGFLKGTHKQE